MARTHRHSFRLGHLLATATKPEEWFAECACGERAPVEPPLHHYYYPYYRPYWYWWNTSSPYWVGGTWSTGSTGSTTTISGAISNPTSTYQLSQTMTSNSAVEPTLGEVKCTCPKACRVHGEDGLPFEAFIS